MIFEPLYKTDSKGKTRVWNIAENPHEYVGKLVTVRYFAEMAIVQDAETETPQFFKNTEAAVTGKINTPNEPTPIGSNVNQ